MFFKQSFDQTLKRKNPPYLNFFVPSVIFERENYCKTQKEAKSPFSMHITGKEPSSLDFVNFYQSLLWTTKHLDMILDKPAGFWVKLGRGAFRVFLYSLFSTYTYIELL